MSQDNPRLEMPENSQILGELSFGRLVYSEIESGISLINYDLGFDYPLKEVSHSSRPIKISDFKSKTPVELAEVFQKIGMIKDYLPNDKFDTLVQILPRVMGDKFEGKSVSNIKWQMYIDTQSNFGFADLTPEEFRIVTKRLGIIMEYNPFVHYREDIPAIFSNFEHLPSTSIDRLEKLVEFILKLGTPFYYQEAYTEHRIQPGAAGGDHVKRILDRRAKLTEINWEKTMAHVERREEFRSQFNLEIETIYRNPKAFLDIQGFSSQVFPIAIVEHSFDIENDKTKRSGIVDKKIIRNRFVFMDGIPIKLDSEAQTIKDDSKAALVEFNKKYAKLREVMGIQHALRGYGNKGNG